MEFNLHNYWQNRYQTGGNSGRGSYGDEALEKAEFINDVIFKYEIKTVMEWACGDGNNITYYGGYQRLWGYDISEKAIELCMANQQIDHKKCVFTTDINACRRTAHLGLLLDVLFHQVNDEDYLDLLDMVFERSQHMYVIVYATNTDNNVGMSAHMRNRLVEQDINKRYPNYKLLHKVQGDCDSSKFFFLYENQDYIR